MYKECPFFNDVLPDMPSTSNLMKKNYCDGDFKRCARHMVTTTVGKEHVQKTLFPSNVEEASQIIANHKNE